MLRYIDEQEAIPYATLNYLFASVNYGGRVTDYQDQRPADSILAKCANRTTRGIPCRCWDTVPLWRYCAARDTLCWHGIQCRRYICPEALDPTYDFAEGGTYHTLANGDLAAYREYVRSLPLADIPEVFIPSAGACAVRRKCFGLHCNARTSRPLARAGTHKACARTNAHAQVFGLHRNAEITFEKKETNQMLDSLTTIQPRMSSGGAGKKPDDIVREMAQDIADRTPETMNLDDASAVTFAVLTTLEYPIGRAGWSTCWRMGRRWWTAR